MYGLVNVALIDWFLLGRQDLPMRGAVGLYGENRSGKSTLLDAIQTVMLSNDKNALQLNAAANPERRKKNRRSVHAYCLGRLGGAGEPPLRDSARSHLALAFHDPADGRSLSTGLILEARQSETREEVRARWLALGLRVTTADLVRPTPEGEVARNWAELEEHLAARCAAEGGELRCYMSAAEHVGDLLHCGSQTGQHGGVEQFRRAFANAVSFETIEDESAFIRSYVLDRDPISIRDLRESMRNYREIAETIRALLRQIEDLDAILAAAGQHAALVEEKSLRGWMVRRARVRLGLREARRLRRDLRRATAEVARLDALIADREARIDGLRVERIRLEQAMQGSPVARELQALALDIQTRKQEVSEHFLPPVREWETAVARAASIPGLRQSGQTEPAFERLRARWPELLPALAALQRLSGADRLPAWPADPTALEGVLAGLPDLDGLIRALGDEADALVREWRPEEGERLRERLAAIERTGSAISRETGAFLLDLENEGFKPRLLCAEIELLDPRWTDAAEAVLGRDREAVILPPDQARRAVALLRADRRAARPRYRGCRVVNTARLSADSPQPGSLAAVLRARDPLAAAFLAQRVGNVRLVETEAELHQGGRAVTADGAYCDGLVSEMRTVEERKIGADATGAARRALEARLREIEAAEQEAEAQIRALRDVADRLKPLAAALAQPVGLADTVKAYRDRRDAIARLEEEQGRLRDEVAPDLRQRLEAIDAELKDLRHELDGTPAKPGDRPVPGARRARDDALRAEGEARKGYTQAYPELRAALSGYEEERRRVTFAQAIPAWQRECTRWRGAMPALIRACDERLGALGEEIPRARQQVLARLAEFRYTSRRGFSFAPEASIADEIRPWAEKLRADIAEKDLAQHRRRAEEAVEEAQKLLKGNFVNMLRDRFERVKTAIALLNDVLRQHAFHNERYTFQVEPDADFAGLIDLVAAATLDETILLPLFGGAAVNESFHAESLKLIDAILMEDDIDVSRYEDYRNYFRFSLIMTDVESGVRTSFAHRLGVGSGAEKQVPFYVAIGAALSSAYHNGAFAADKPGGLGLALFDEAFMKMDPKNQREVLHFYREIGLQPVLAGPKGSKLMMQKQMDTLIKVSRPSYRRMALTVLHPGEALRAALVAQDPAEWSRDQLERALRAASG